jgi:predicted amino acid racemase
LTAPRLEIDLGKIHHNARTLVSALGKRGIAVTGVTKASLGSPEIAGALLRAGVRGLGDSRIENIESMRRAPVLGSMTLIRSPMMGQVDRIVKHADVSFNTEIDVIRKLSAAARSAGRIHGVVLMVELGDLREGIMPADVENIARQTLRLPNIQLAGIGTNLACRNGVSPDASNMAELSALACSLEANLGLELNVISGGNSANLQWAFSGDDCGRINDLRLGESILLGREPLHRQPIAGLHTDAITLVAEVIESKKKPSQPSGVIAQAAFGKQVPAIDRGLVAQAILALGCQDIDPLGLRAPPGIEVLAASSDHLIVDCGPSCPRVGSEIPFQLNYSALLRAMTSPYVSRAITTTATEVPAVAEDSVATTA